MHPHSVLFDIESYDYGYYDEGSEGLKVAVVHHLDMPIIRQRAFHVAPGTENQIPVTPTLYTATDQVRKKERITKFGRCRARCAPCAAPHTTNCTFLDYD